MPAHSSPKNKTLVLQAEDLDRLQNKLMKLCAPRSVREIMDRTILGDALEVIDNLPLQFVDLLFIDPPYNINKCFGEKRFRKMGSDDYENWVHAWLSKLVEKLTPTASVYVCGDWRSSSALFRALSHYFTIRNRITWEREKGRGAKVNWKNASEDIWFATVSEDYYFNVDAVKLKRKVNAPYREDSGKPKDWSEEANGNFRLTHPSNLWTDLTVPFWSMPENTNHPTQKPEKLMAKLILASSEEGDVILDPFLGSGTSSVVAKKLGRHFVGIEIDRYFACVAERRLEMAETDNRIQGYADGVFWQRNANPRYDSAKNRPNRRRSLL